MNNKEYIEKLENVIKQMLQPLKEIPFGLVIQSISNCEILPFDKNNKDDIIILENLQKATIIAGKIINQNGIGNKNGKLKRPNEIGNEIESYIKQGLNEVGYEADIPTTKNNKKRSVGYPDIVFYDHNKKLNYLECKTFNIKGINSTLRSFFLSPSDDFKITQDAHHFLISLEMYIENNVYRCKSYKIISLESLVVDVKYEFNANNVVLYKNVLKEGIIQF